jgi:membrane-bound lytic murein transglycosylase MltF
VSLTLNEKQKDTLAKIIKISEFFGVDPKWAAAVAMTESSLGLYQVSKTGCKGVFQMSSIAMKDLLLEMTNKDDDLIDIACGIAFLYLLKKRWGSIESATYHYCDPNDRVFYIDRVKQYMSSI